jgi:pilus assembly protein CpaB
VGRRTLLLIASILVAALGTTLVWLYVQGADTRAQADTALVPVMFVTKDAPAGTPIANLTMHPQQVPATVAQTALTSPQQLPGQQLKSDVFAGTMLTPTMFSATPQTQVEKGKAYAAITITDPHRVPALLKQGDRVAIYALTKGGKGSLKLVMDEATVKTLGNITQTGPNGTTVPLTIVGFQVTPEEAASLIDIETYGDPVLALLGQDAKGAQLP